MTKSMRMIVVKEQILFDKEKEMNTPHLEAFRAANLTHSPQERESNYLS
jgi:hypothetical protein